MNTNTADSLARRPWPAIALMVLLHLGLLVAVLRAPAPRNEAPPERQPALWLQLLPAPEPEPAPAAAPRSAGNTSAQPTPRRAPPPTAPQPVRETTLTIVSPDATATAPALSSAPPSAAAAASAAADPPATPPAPPPPLNLSLPRGAGLPSRSPALDDPRSNTRPQTLESRLAELMGPADGPITQEQLPDGSLRLRRGSQCVVVRPSRAGALDPFNQSVSPKPRQADRC